MAKKKKGAGKKKGVAKKPKTPKTGKKAKKGAASKTGKKGKGKGKSKNSKSPPSTGDSILGEGTLVTEPVRTYVPEFSGNVYFRSFTVSSPKALLEMSRRHGTTKSKRILGPLKKISAEEQRVAEEAAALLASKMTELEDLQNAPSPPVEELKTPKTNKKPSTPGEGKKKGKSKKGSLKGSPNDSRPSSPEKASKKKGKKKGKKKKAGNSKNSTPANSRPGTSNGGGENDVDETVNRRGGANFLNDYGELKQAPPADWSVYDHDMAEKRILRENILLAAEGKWKPPEPQESLEETELSERNEEQGEGGLFPSIVGAYDDDGELIQEVEEEDPVERASWVLIRGELRFSNKYRLKAETKAIYNGTSGFRSLSINQDNCDKYGWNFNANKETMEALKKRKVELKFGAF
jgi:hypothetical protein